MQDPGDGRPFCHDCNRWMARSNGESISGFTRYRCGGCRKSTTGTVHSQHDENQIGYDQDAAAKRHAELREAIKNGANRFVVTCAANNCEIDYRAWKSLQRLCEDRKAHLIVLPVHYKNVSLYTAAQQYKKSWARSVEPFLIDQKLRLGSRVWVMGDVRVQATAADPLSGMAPLASGNWAIFGHPQLAMEPIATPMNQLPGRMYTTGAMTQKSYSQTKMGAKAAFHHITGALLIEVSGQRAFIRQLNADHKGHIHDLTDTYTPKRIKRNQRALSLTTGDEHVKFMLPGVKRGTYTGKDSMTAVLRPEYIVRHDILDGYAGSHHHEGNHITQYRKWYHGDGDYRKELDQVAEHINETTPKGSKNVIVKDSNHHDHLNQWLNRADDRKDHLNADLICELRWMQRIAIREGKDPAAFDIYMKDRLKVPTVYASPNEPFMLAGVDHSQHGHKGANGARGSARSIANTTHKATIGHSHSARICKSVHQVGKSCDNLEYESGLSTHTNTHCVQYQNGKRTLVDVLGQSWRATNEPCDGELKAA